MGHLKSALYARMDPAASRGAARLVGLAPVATAVAVALGRVTASPPPLIAGPAS